MTATETHPTARALLEAGEVLAESTGIAAMTIDQIVAQARVAKGTFYVHFRDRATYLADLHRSFHDDLERAVLTSSAGMRPGAARLWRSTEAYLDGCLGRRALKALLLEARSEPLVAREVAARNQRFSAIAREDFEAAGWDHAAETARLYVAMAAEAALAELENGGKHEPTRAALGRFINA